MLTTATLGPWNQRGGAIPPRPPLTNGCPEVRPLNRSDSVLKVGDWLPIELGENLQFDEVDAPITLLNLGYKAGRLSEHLSDLTLSQIDIGSRCQELELKPTVSRTVEGFGHCLSLPDKQAYTRGANAPERGANE